MIESSRVRVMSYATHLLILILLNVLEVGCTTSSLPKQTYRHQDMGISFTASPGWIQGQWPNDPGVYEAMDPDTTVHVVLWHTETEQDARRYLHKMADMKGLNLEPESKKILIGPNEAWFLETTGMHDNKEIQTLLVVIPHGKVETRPRENFIMIAQIWCPEGSSDEDVASMKDIMNTLRIED